MGETLTVDARGLPAPEPMERVIEALDGLAADTRLRLLIHREPVPLYDILGRRGCRWHTEEQPDGSFVIMIWREA